MKEFENFETQEIKEFEEYKKYDAVEYYKSLEQTTFKENITINEVNTFHKNHENNNSNTPQDIKKNVDKIIESTSSFSANICATVATAAAVVVTAVSLVNSPPKIDLLTLDIKDTSVEYELDIQGLHDDSSYYIEISNPHYEYIKDITDEGVYKDNVLDLKPFTMYDLKVKGKDKEVNVITTYYAYTFYTKNISQSSFNLNYQIDYDTLNIDLTNLKQLNYQSYLLEITSDKEFYQKFMIDNTQKELKIPNLYKGIYTLKLLGINSDQSSNIIYENQITINNNLDISSNIEEYFYDNNILTGFIKINNPNLLYQIFVKDLTNDTLYNVSYTVNNDLLEFSLDIYLTKYQIYLYEGLYLSDKTDVLYTNNSIENLTTKYENNIFEIVFDSTIIKDIPKITLYYETFTNSESIDLPVTKENSRYIATFNCEYLTSVSFDITINDVPLYIFEHFSFTYNEVMNLTHIPYMDKIDIKATLLNNTLITLSLTLLNDENSIIDSIYIDYQDTYEINYQYMLNDPRITKYNIQINEQYTTLYEENGTCSPTYLGNIINNNDLLIEQDYDNNKLNITYDFNNYQDYTYQFILENEIGSSTLVYNGSNVITFDNVDYTKINILKLEYIRLYDNIVIPYDIQIINDNITYPNPSFNITNATYLSNFEYLVNFDILEKDLDKITNIEAILVKDTIETSYQISLDKQNKTFNIIAPTSDTYNIILNITYQIGNNFKTIHYENDTITLVAPVITYDNLFIDISNIQNIEISLDTKSNHHTYDIKITNQTQYETFNGNELYVNSYHMTGSLGLNTLSIYYVDENDQQVLEEFKITKEIDILNNYQNETFSVSCPNPGEGVIVTQNEDLTLNIYLNLIIDILPLGFKELVMATGMRKTNAYLYKYICDDSFVRLEDLEFDTYYLSYYHLISEPNEDYSYIIYNTYTPSGGITFENLSQIQCITDQESSTFIFGNYFVDDDTHQSKLLINDTLYDLVTETNPDGEIIKCNVPFIYSNNFITEYHGYIKCYDGHKYVYVNQEIGRIPYIDYYQNILNQQFKGDFYVYVEVDYYVTII